MNESEITNWSDAEIEDLINSVYGGSISPSKLPVNIYKEITRRLTAGVAAGFGGDVTQFDTGSRNLDLLEHFNHNVAIFSGAKTHQQVVDMTKEVFKDGTKVPFGEFKDSARKIFDTYNKDWLLTEYNMANNSALSGRQWLDITRNADIFPGLKYSTVGDGRVRHDHAVLDGTIKPVNDPFWSRYYPPNDWGCRCTVEQITESELKQHETPDADVERLTKEYKPSKLFDGNVGIDKIIWQPEHPYFLVADRFKLLKQNNFNLPTPPLPKPFVPEKPVVVPEVPKTNPTIDRIHASMKSVTKLSPDFANPRIWNSVSETLEFRGGKDISAYLKARESHWFYDPTVKKIYINTGPERWKQSARWRPMVTTHEIGHDIHLNLGQITNQFMSDRATKFIDDLKLAFQKRFPTAVEKSFFEYSYSSTSGVTKVGAFVAEKGEQSMSFQGEMFSTFSDVVGGLTSGDWGGGHSVEYYRKHDGRQGFKEVFANLFQVTQQTDQIHRETWNEFFPEAVNIADEYFNDILK